MTGGNNDATHGAHSDDDAAAPNAGAGAESPEEGQAAMAQAEEAATEGDAG